MGTYVTLFRKLKKMLMLCYDCNLNLYLSKGEICCAFSYSSVKKGKQHWRLVQANSELVIEIAINAPLLACLCNTSASRLGAVKVGFRKFGSISINS